SPKASTAKEPAAPKAVSASSPEEAALFRRLEACDKLTQIAITNNDDALLHRAEELNQRAWTAYNQQAPRARTHKGGVESDEAVIERLLDPELDDRAGNTASSREPSKDARAAAKEVNP